MTKPPDETLRGAQRPRAVERIADAVAKLTVPPLTPLYQTFLDVQSGVREKRAQLTREQDDAREEGFEAATRLALSLVEVSPQHVSYFDQLTRGEQP